MHPLRRLSGVIKSSEMHTQCVESDLSVKSVLMFTFKKEKLPNTANSLLERTDPSLEVTHKKSMMFMPLDGSLNVIWSPSALTADGENQQDIRNT